MHIHTYTCNRNHYCNSSCQVIKASKLLLNLGLIVGQTELTCDNILQDLCKPCTVKIKYYTYGWASTACQRLTQIFAGVLNFQEVQ